MFTLYITASCDDLSSYFLCSNDSNELLGGRKLIRGLEMRGNFVIEKRCLAGPSWGVAAFDGTRLHPYPKNRGGQPNLTRQTTRSQRIGSDRCFQSEGLT
jgi:hypothetical protein